MNSGLLLGRDSFHRVSQRLYPGPLASSATWARLSSHRSDQRIPVYVQDHEADPDQFLCRSTPTVIDINLIRSIGTRRL